MSIDLQEAGQMAAFVRENRKRQKVTQVQLSQLANVGVRFVRDLEDGKPSLQFDKLLQVLNALGVSVTLSITDSANVDA